MTIQGFFPGSKLAQVKAPPSMLPKCGACGFAKKCKRPKRETTGLGKKGILIVSAHPSKAEDDTGSLESESTSLLERELNRHGIDLHEDCWLDYALICKPSSKVTPQHIEHCRPNIIKRIKKLKPKCIILLGGHAVRSVIGWLWKPGVGKAERWNGYNIPSQQINAWVCPTYNPHYVLMEKDGKNPLPEVFFKKHIAKAVTRLRRPWKTIPTWDQDIDRIYDVKRAAKILRKMIRKGGTVAFDYEGNMLKPEGPASQIVSCSVCWEGKKTIAYPWYGEAVKATRELLRSPLGKIAANLKFEERWTRYHLRTRVRNWEFDTMLGGHILDPTEGTKSLKFQAFVYLGMGSYNDHIEKFFESKGTMEPNDILTEISLDDLLLYNGLDSLLEYKLARVQQKLIKQNFKA